MATYSVTLNGREIDRINETIAHAADVKTSLIEYGYDQNIEVVKVERKRRKSLTRRQIMDEVAKDSGMTRVRGNLGGTFYE